jgi:hypothetical protein
MRSSNHQQTDNPDADRILVIMAKAPRLGRVKTRLSQEIPPTAVVELYRCLLHDTIALARSLPETHVAIMCPASDVEDLSREVGHDVAVLAQTGDGLAAGLSSVFAHFAAGQRRIIALDSDSPHVPSSVLVTAFSALESCELVVGPTQDGGYYLVGATASQAGLFASTAMGTTNALDTLLLRARELGLSVTFTDPFYDIDVVSDLERLALELRLAPERAPRTAIWLQEWTRMRREHPTSVGAQ